MPYIEQTMRYEIDRGSNPRTPGELNYFITKHIHQYMNMKLIGDPINYALLNEIMGVLECAKSEFWRRYVIPYENEKMKENGDVY